MKTLITVFCLLPLLVFLGNNSTKDHSSQNFNITEKTILNCPEPPSFYEFIDQGRSKSVSQDEIDQDWYSRTLGKIEKEEYNITYNEKLGAYQSPNRANNIRFIYHNDGFTAKTRSTKIPKFDVNDRTIEEKDKKYEIIDEWSVKLKVENLHQVFSSPRVSSGDPQFHVAGNKAWIENCEMRIDYINNEEGMRQDFIIKNKPVGSGNLRLNMSVDTKLKMIVGADALMFKDNEGSEKMKYSALKAWDAEGKELRAYFEKDIPTPYAKGGIEGISRTSNSLSIIVNDENAAYPVTIDPLSTSPDWTAESNQADCNFGRSVSTAGDVNGDGYGDVIIGALYYDQGQTNEGRAFVYLGSAAGLPVNPSWTAENNQAGSEFGISVSTAGDVNGDGYSDVIVGSHNYYNGQINEGGAFAYYGSASGLSAAANWSAESNQAYSRFGNCVSSAGDVNGDGYSDVIVGAHNYSNGQSFEGAAFVYYGSSSGLSASPNWFGESNQPGTDYGISVSSAGDVNGDGFSDVIVGAPLYYNGQSNEGVAFAYYGSSTGLSASANWIGEYNQPGAEFGISVCTAGDVNGDGYSDVIIGANWYDNGQTSEGGAFVFQGSAAGLSLNVSWIGESDQQDAYYGYSVSTAGDVNGDGYCDVIVGSYYYDNGLTNEGRAFVYHGTASGLSAAANWTAESDQAEAYFGYDVSAAGDVNGDGYSDVIVGAPYYDNVESNEGRAFVYHGSASGLPAAANWTAESNQSEAWFSYSVSSAGDVNGDGYCDVIIGAHFFDNGQTDEGRTYVYHGSASGLSTTANWTSESNQAYSKYGYSVASAGDVNGDGFADVIVGAREYDNPESGEGGAFVYYGSSGGLSAVPNWTAESDQINAYFGSSVACAGDVNGDGFSDVIISALSYDNGQSDEGKVFLYYGSAIGLSANANWTAESNQVYPQFGISVASAGDVNGDGYSDVVIGAAFYDNGQTDEGRAFVYLGSQNGPSPTADWTAESNQASSYFGYSVASAGDVNGDGYSDVIIGSFYYTNGESSEGRAFVFNGSSSGLTASPSWTAEGNQASAYFGSSVSTAGDVNGDGYSDVIVAAHGYDNGQSNEGRVFVFNGSPTGLSASSSWTAESDQLNAWLGISVSTAGDVNGDGYSDIIAGAYLYDFGQLNEGKAFVYYGNAGTSLKTVVQQYRPYSNNIVYSGGLTGTDGQVRLSVFGKSPFGRADGRIVYEYKDNGVKFSGTIITNSTSSSGSGTNTDLGTSVTGVQLNRDITGLLTNKVYKWRARVQYSLVNNPYQKFGPWKYYNNYTPIPHGNFRAKDPPGNKQLNLTMFIQGFYDPGSNVMVSDTVRVYLRNATSPYAVVDVAKANISSSGSGTFMFPNAANGVNYYIELKHRNSIETWSKTPQAFVNNLMSYDFTTAIYMAYEDNMIQVDTSPEEKFAIFGGDVNQDGAVDATDLSAIDNDAANFVTGYVVTDLTGDYFVDATDFAIADNNAKDYVTVRKPGEKLKN